MLLLPRVGTMMTGQSRWLWEFKRAPNNSEIKMNYNLRWVLRVFSSCSMQALLFMAVPGLLIVGASLAAECMLFSVLAQKLGHMGFVALQHVKSSCTRDQIHGPCIGRWILIHCTTREVPEKELLPRVQLPHTSCQAPPTNHL